MRLTRNGEEDLFEAFRELKDPAERSAYLEKTCENDPTLRARLEELLASQDEADQFFTEGGVASSLRGPSPASSASWSASTSQGVAPSGALDEESVGTRIGRYK